MNKSLGIGFVGGGFITKFHIQSMIGVRDCQKFWGYIKDKIFC